MKTGFYPKLALDGFRKNKRMYLPYILTCIGMVMMYYIITFLHYTDTLAAIPGASIVQEMLGMGISIIALFSCIFLFYTNSFLIRRRKKEFGLYNILGMGKGNIGVILFWENLMIAAAALSAGLLLGIVVSKLAELGLVRLMAGSAGYSLSVSSQAVISTLKTFSIIFVLLFLNGVWQVRFSSAITLLRSENAGEKPPRASWFVGLSGVVLLAAAYYLSVTIQDPLAALTLFFLAVMLVIVGTYLVMIAGSVLFCRILQKNKSYYYRTNHFVSVSSMVYRMNRNGAGLASICILATMVLVMISSTTALYVGGGDAIEKRFLREYHMEFTFREPAQADQISGLEAEIRDLLAQRSSVPENSLSYHFVTAAGLIQGSSMELNLDRAAQAPKGTYSDAAQVFLIPLSDYNAISGTNRTLAENEVLLWMHDVKGFENGISFTGGPGYAVREVLPDFFAGEKFSVQTTPTLVLIVPDLEAACEALTASGSTLRFQWIWEFDTGLEAREQVQLHQELREIFAAREQGSYSSFYFEGQESSRTDFFAVYGGLLYLGIVLSVVFLFATVLIIYYKQISEGYEDQSRFQIMQKVGITKEEIRRSINSQLLTVFFLPLILAGIHLMFAFPMICKLLRLLQLSNISLFAFTTLASFLLFGLSYLAVYRATSNAYYKIVSMQT